VGKGRGRGQFHSHSHTQIQHYQSAAVPGGVGCLETGKSRGEESVFQREDAGRNVCAATLNRYTQPSPVLGSPKFVSVCLHRGHGTPSARDACRGVRVRASVRVEAVRERVQSAGVTCQRQRSKRTGTEWRFNLHRHKEHVQL